MSTTTPDIVDFLTHAKAPYPIIAQVPEQLRKWSWDQARRALQKSFASNNVDIKLIKTFTLLNNNTRWQIHAVDNQYNDIIANTPININGHPIIWVVQDPTYKLKIWDTKGVIVPDTIFAQFIKSMQWDVQKHYVLESDGWAQAYRYVHFNTLPQQLLENIKSLKQRKFNVGRVLYFEFVYQSDLYRANEDYNLNLPVTMADKLKQKSMLKPKSNTHLQKRETVITSKQANTSQESTSDNHNDTSEISSNSNYNYSNSIGKEEQKSQDETSMITMSINTPTIESRPISESSFNAEEVSLECACSNEIKGNIDISAFTLQINSILRKQLKNFDNKYILQEYKKMLIDIISIINDNDVIQLSNTLLTCPHNVNAYFQAMLDTKDCSIFKSAYDDCKRYANQS